MPAVRPEPSGDWHGMAADWFRSLGESGQAAFYQPSDWQQARVLAEILSGLLLAARPSSEMFKAWQSGAAELLTTEGARRRARVELEQPAATDDDAGDAAVLSVVDRLSG